jgi:hypothetical protein
VPAFASCPAFAFPLQGPCTHYICLYNATLQGDTVLDLYDAVATQEVPYPRHRPISYELQARQRHRQQQQGGTGAPEQ